MYFKAAFSYKYVLLLQALQMLFCPFPAGTFAPSLQKDYIMGHHSILIVFLSAIRNSLVYIRSVNADFANQGL